MGGGGVGQESQRGFGQAEDRGAVAARNDDDLEVDQPAVGDGRLDASEQTALRAKAGQAEEREES